MLTRIKLVRKKSSIIDWSGLVGGISNGWGCEILIYSWDSVNQKIKIRITDGQNRQTREEISLALGESRFLNTLETNYLFFAEIIDESFEFSTVATTKAQGLVQAGFSKLIRAGGNYTVDGIFPQNFLTQEELEYLLSLLEAEISLSEIK